MEKTLISGITGQTGSYLADLLLEKGCEVHGIIRRSSIFNTERIEHLMNNPKIYNKKLFLHYGDMVDSSSLSNLISKTKPDYVFNMAAQSHVQVSFEVPEYTADVDGVGVLKMLDAIHKHSKESKFYQASTSELYGGVPEEMPSGGYVETSPFHPRSPYGAAKLYGYWITRNYREAYNLFASNGILFNHECLTYQMPILIRENGLIDIKPIGEIVPYSIRGKDKQTTLIDNLEVWDKNGFTKVTCATATKNKNRNVRKIVSRMGVVETTSDHIWLDENGLEIRCDNLSVGSKLEKSSLPEANEKVSCTKEMAWLLGVMSADGSITKGEGKFINKNIDLIKRVEDLWVKVSNGYVEHDLQKSGFTNKNNISLIYLKGDRKLLEWIESIIYTKERENVKRFKRVPKIILNSSKDIIKEFLDGYCEGDGTKSLPKTLYRFQYYTTISATLALGLRYCINAALGVDVTYNMYGKNNNVYKGFLRSSRHENIDGQRGKSGHNLMKPQNEIVKIFERNAENEFVFDLETESGKFTAGTGLNRIHNSPRRTPTFVTRKITKWCAKWFLNNFSSEPLRLGNIYAYRDWGHAKDYAGAIVKILQHSQPDDFVIATGETHTVKEFVEACFKYLNKTIEWIGKGVDEKGLCDGKIVIEIDSKYFRPSEVELLLGNPAKSKQLLNWTPEHTFHSLVEDMMGSEIKGSK